MPFLLPLGSSLFYFFAMRLVQEKSPFYLTSEAGEAYTNPFFLFSCPEPPRRKKPLYGNFAHSYYLIGARYYDADIGMWISPDPGRQFHSLYSYGNNPINGIDPDGEWFGYAGDDTYISETSAYIELLRNDPATADMINALDASKHLILLSQHEGLSNYVTYDNPDIAAAIGKNELRAGLGLTDILGTLPETGTGSTVSWNNRFGSSKFSLTNLTHELGHSYEGINSAVDPRGGRHPLNPNIPRREWGAIQWENKTRLRLDLPACSSYPCSYE